MPRDEPRILRIPPRILRVAYITITPSDLSPISVRAAVYTPGPPDFIPIGPEGGAWEIPGGGILGLDADQERIRAELEELARRAAARPTLRLDLG